MSLGGTAATGVTVVNSTSITATTPANSAGAVDVVVTNTDGQNGSLPDAYTYTSAAPGLDLGVRSGNSGSATVIAGNTASYTLSIGGDGMSGTASPSCTGALMDASCSIPANQPFSDTDPTTFNVSVTTTARTIGALHVPTFTPVAWLWAFAILGIVLRSGTVTPRRSLRRYLRFTPLTLLLVLVSCWVSCFWFRAEVVVVPVVSRRARTVPLPELIL